MITCTLNLTNDRIVHQFRGRASNIYVIVDNRREASFLVDCGMPSDAKALTEILLRMPPLKRIVCTHFHVDHVSGWIHLKTIFKNCSLWFHENGTPWVMGRERIPFPSFGDLKKVLKNVQTINGYKKQYGSRLPRLIFQFIPLPHNEHEIK